MLTAASLPSDQLNDYSVRFLALVRKHGFFVTHVLGKEGQPGFAYTTGLWERFGHPELIILGLEGGLAHDLMWDAFHLIEAGEKFVDQGASDKIFRGQRCLFKSVTRKSCTDYLCSSDWYYMGQPFEALQMFWPDESGRFPWETEVEETCRFAQPDLSR